MTGFEMLMVVIAGAIGAVAGFASGVYLGWDLRGESGAARLEAVAETARQMEDVALRTRQAMQAEAARYVGEPR